jgi:hypothetical protein
MLRIKEHSMKRFAFISALFVLPIRKLFGFQTRTDASQTAYAAATIPSLLMIGTDGKPRLAQIGTGFSIVTQGNITTISSVVSGSSAVQRLTLEPDKLSWRITSAIGPTPKVFRNGLLQLPGADYILESSASVVRPTAAQGTLETDIWTAHS